VGEFHNSETKGNNNIPGYQNISVKKYISRRSYLHT